MSVSASLMYMEENHLPQREAINEYLLAIKEELCKWQRKGKEEDLLKVRRSTVNKTKLYQFHSPFFTVSTPITQKKQIP